MDEAVAAETPDLQAQKQSIAAVFLALALAAFTLLVFWKVPPWLVVILTAGGGWGLQLLAGLGLR